jgi:hypothetical protein
MVLAGSLALVGCGDSTKRALGLTKTAPDEFAVVSRAPLSQPPDYGLRPPRPGAPSLARATPTQEAKATLFGDGQGIAGSNPAFASRPAGSPNAAPRLSVSTTTTGESALLAKAGAGNADPNIRTEIDRESAVLAVANQNFIQKLLDFSPETTAETVDASAESRRLRENEALGKPVTTGETPTIERREGGLLDNLF